MLRHFLLASVLFALSQSPLKAQTTVDTTVRADSAWHRDWPDSSQFWHTTKLTIVTTTVTTAQTALNVLDSTTRHPVTPPPPPPSGPGLAVGMWNWPADSFCTGRVTATATGMSPSDVLKRVQKAASCGFRIVIVPPRRYITTQGTVGAPFSIDSAKKLSRAYATVLLPDTLKKYRTTILGFNLADDYGCASCWGGVTVTQSQIAAWAAYMRTLMPGLPLAVRVEPWWVEKVTNLAPLIDFTYGQYHTGKGDLATYFERVRASAARQGLKVIYGVNVKYCGGLGTSACTPTQLTTFGTAALAMPTCAMLGWEWTGTTWTSTLRPIWATFVATGKAKSTTDCRVR
jgi:hypothetical protein